MCKLFFVDMEKDPNNRNNRYLKEALAVLMDMEKKNIKPDITTLNAFINGLCSPNVLKIEDSLLLLKAMTSQNILPDAYTYTILFSAMGSLGLLELALDLYKSNLVAMDTTATNALLQAFVESDNPLTSIDVFNALISKNETAGKVEMFIPDKVTYTILFKAIAKFVSTSEMLTGINKENTDRKNLISNFATDDLNLTQDNDNIESISLFYEEINFNGRYDSISLQEVYKNINLNKYSTNINRIVEKKYGSGSSFSISNYDVTIKSYMLSDINTIVKSLFSQLRYDYKIEPDLWMVNSINSLFSQNMRMSRSIYSNKEILNKETARFIFQEIVIAGFHPRDILAVLNSCGYSIKQVEEYIYDEKLIKKLRASAASYRIFTKHGWNKVQSGWSTIF